MSKGKRRKAIRRRAKSQEQILQKPPEHSKKNLLKKIFSPIYIFVGVLTLLLGLPITYYSYSSKIKIYPDVYLDPSDPSSVSFVFENESFFPLYNIDYQFYFRNIRFNNNRGFESVFLKSNEPPLKIFDSGQSFSDFIVFPFDLGENSFWLSADIDVEITYKPKFLFWEETISKRFVGKKDSKNVLKWLSAKPLNDLPPPDKRSILLYTGKRKY